MSSEFRRLPGVDQVLAHPGLEGLAGRYPHQLRVEVVRESLAEARRRVAGGEPALTLDEVAAMAVARLLWLEGPRLRPVINATGVVLHTNLGRAPLSREALEAMATASARYSNLELDLATGRRGSRQVHVEELLCRLSGAEAAMVVNNNAAGVLLALTALAKRREVIVSRGQAVEIGGSFRIPDVMRQSGAKLVEVGTTNRTYVRDYEEAITPRTAALLRVHSSNFRVVGFVHEATLEEMVEVGRRHGVPVLDDLGSGCFLETTTFGLAHEPTVQESVAGGAGLTLFSGDKLVGGPQAGIIVGVAGWVARLKRHPLARALRPDKTRLAALEATLRHYLRGEAVEKVPVWRMIATPLAEIEGRAKSWADALGGRCEVVPGESMVGGGSLPGSTLPTRLVAIARWGRTGATALAARLRERQVPIVGRVAEGRLLLDPRTVLPEEDGLVVAALRELGAPAAGKGRG